MKNHKDFEAFNPALRIGLEVVSLARADKLREMARQVLSEVGASDHGEPAVDLLYARVTEGALDVLDTLSGVSIRRDCHALLSEVFAQQRQNDGGGSGQSANDHHGRFAQTAAVSEKPERAAGEGHGPLDTQRTNAPASTETPAGAAATDRVSGDTQESPVGRGSDRSIVVDEKLNITETRESAGGERHSDHGYQVESVLPAKSQTPPRDLAEARAKRAASYGEKLAASLLIQGVALKDSTVRAVRDWGRENAARASFADTITRNQPDDGIIGACCDLDFVGRAWKQAHGREDWQ